MIGLLNLSLERDFEIMCFNPPSFLAHQNLNHLGYCCDHYGVFTLVICGVPQGTPCQWVSSLALLQMNSNVRILLLGREVGWGLRIFLKFQLIVLLDKAWALLLYNGTDSQHHPF